MLNRDEIISRLVEAEQGYSCQDNIVAASVARYLRRLLAEINGEDYPPHVRRDVDAVTPDLADLKRKFLG